MKTMKKIAICLAIAAIASLSLLSSCSKAPATTTVACTTGSMTANLNGTAFTAASFQNTLFRGTANGVDAKRFDLRATNSAGKTLIISISDYRDGKVGEGMRTGTYFLDATENLCNSNQSACVGVLVTYDGAIYLPVGTGSVSVTSCDATNHTITGTISGSVEDYSGNTFTISNTTFTNCCYSLVQ